MDDSNYRFSYPTSVAFSSEEMMRLMSQSPYVTIGRDTSVKRTLRCNKELNALTIRLTDMILSAERDSDLDQTTKEVLITECRRLKRYVESIPRHSQV